MKIGPVEIKYVPRPPTLVDRFTPDEREILGQARRVLMRPDRPLTWRALMTADNLRDLLHRDELQLHEEILHGRATD